MQRFVFLTLAAGAALVGLAIVGVYFYERPTVMRVAVPRGSEFHKLLSALNQEFIHSREDIHFKILPTSDERAAAKAMENGGADLAVVRSDLPMPINAQTALIFGHYSAVIVAPPGSGLREFSDLAGKSIAVVETEPSGDANRALLKTVESHYAFPQDAIRIVPASLGDIPKLLRSGEVDAVFVFSLFPLLNTLQ